MLDQKWVESIKSWVAAEDIGALHQWLDSLKGLEPIAREHNLTNMEIYTLFFQAHQLNKLAQIRDLLQNIIDMDMGRGDTPHA